MANKIAKDIYYNEKMTKRNLKAYYLIACIFFSPYYEIPSI